MQYREEGKKAYLLHEYLWFSYHKCLLEHFTGLNGLNKEQVSLLFIINDVLYWLHISAREPLVSLCNKSINSWKGKVLIACGEREQNIKLDFVIPNHKSIKLCCHLQSFLTPSPLLSLLVHETCIYVSLKGVLSKCRYEDEYLQEHHRYRCIAGLPSYTVSPLMIMYHLCLPREPDMNYFYSFKMSWNVSEAVHSEQPHTQLIF